MGGLFLDGRRLTYGSWSAFERDVARLLLQHGFTDVRIVGGSGDHGADVLGIKHGKLWVVQCKFRSQCLSGASAVDEVVAAARYYEADRLAIAASQPFSRAMIIAINRWEKLGVYIEQMPRAVLAGMAESSPQYAPTRQIMRPYQARCTARIRAALQDTGRAQIVLATGLGKSVIMAETTAGLWRDGQVAHGRVLVLADKIELIGQLQQAFWQQLPKDIPTHLLCGGEAPVFWDGVTFATVQSAEAQMWNLPRFGLVWVDEAHHIGASTYRDLIAQIDPPMLGGGTATPWRGDSYDIDQMLGKPVVRIDIAQGIKRGYLSKIDYRLMAEDLDRLALHRQPRKVQAQHIIPVQDMQAARTLAQVFAQENRRQMVVFCPTVDEARLFAATLRLVGFHAAAVTSTMPTAVRGRVMSQFRRGQLNAVTTVDIFNEGVDVPNVDMLGFMRMTHSRRIFFQQLGRGLRTVSGKDKVVVVDFVSDIKRLQDVVGLKRTIGDRFDFLGQVENLVRFNSHDAAQFVFDLMQGQVASPDDNEEDALESAIDAN
ncbi:DEAD/DEAH box helicase family protein [Massilia sp. LjRoot122]|uniref:DEAD/DEAH box helicase family protein n=1 Tax=Massilia sp. LjRoot122 TaxID=3342257 RepID=UPI003ECCEB75